MEHAKEIALNHAKVSEADAYFDSQDFETDDGVTYYELEFEVGQNEYDYEIDAVSGEILKFEHDLEEVKKKAPEHAGVSKSSVFFDDVGLDTDDGRKIWEISFDSGNWEFDYEIDRPNRENN